MKSWRETRRRGGGSEKRGRAHVKEAGTWLKRKRRTGAAGGEHGQGAGAGVALDAGQQLRALLHDLLAIFKGACMSVNMT